MLGRTLVAGVLLWAAIAGAIRAIPGSELRDYGSFIGSGRAASQGENPYGIHPLTFHVVLPGFDVWNPNLNPPVSLLLFAALDRLDPHVGFRVWWVLSLAAYGLAVALLLRRYGGTDRFLYAAWAFALAGVWDTLALGQIYLPIVLACVTAWLLLDRGHIAAAGVVIGVVIAIKPNFVVWPVLLALAGQIRPAATAMATMSILWAAPLVVYGGSVYLQWFDLIASDRGRAAFLTNASLPGLLERAGFGRWALAASAGILMALAAWAMRRPPLLHVSALGLVGGILASPIAWVHYALLLVPAFFAASPRPAILAAAGLLVMPVPFVLAWLDTALWQQLTFGSAYNWAMLLCLCGWAYGDFAVHSNDNVAINRESSAASAARSDVAFANSCCSSASRDSCSSS